MDNKLVMSVLAAAAIYMVIAVLFGAGIKLIATEVPVGRMDPQFAPVVCKLSVACSNPEMSTMPGPSDESSLQDDVE